LKKLSYCACNEEERLYYDNLGTLKIDVKICCSELLKYLTDKEKYTFNSPSLGKYKEIYTS